MIHILSAFSHVFPCPVATLQMFQQLTGANYFFYYGATVFKSVGISDSYVTQIILGAVNFGCTFIGLYIMERVSLSAVSRK